MVRAATLVSRDQTYLWILDLVTGLVLLACGALGTQRRPGSLVGPLFFASSPGSPGPLWSPPRFIGTAIAPSVVFLYRGFLAHVIVTFPTGRPADRLEWLAVGIGYATSLLAPLWYSPSPHRPLAPAGRRHLAGLPARSRVDEGGPTGRVSVWPSSSRRRWRSSRSGSSCDLPYPFGDAMTIAFHLVLDGLG